MTVRARRTTSVRPTESSHRERERGSGGRLLLALLTPLLAIALAGCGGSSSSNTPGSPGASHSKASAPTPSCTIPQNNGGDHDADNNGGPDDGDGCDV